VGIPPAGTVQFCQLTTGNLANERGVILQLDTASWRFVEPLRARSRGPVRAFRLVVLSKARQPSKIIWSRERFCSMNPSRFSLE
jgi:hypothetical protein